MKTHKPKKRFGVILVIIGVICLAAAVFLIVYNIVNGLRAESFSHTVVSEIEEYIAENETEQQNETAPTKTDQNKVSDRIFEGYSYIGYQKLCKMSDVDVIDHKYKSVVANLKKRIGELKFHEENISYKLKTLYAEIADSISGLSTYSPEQLSEAITELRSKQESVKLKLAQLQNEAMDRTQLRSSIQYRMKEMQRIMNRFFEPNAKFEEKRVIVNKLFESVTIGRGKNKKYSMTFKLREEFVDFFSD